MINIITLKDIERTTNNSYSQFCGVNLLEIKQGIHFVRSEEREKELR